MQLKKQDETGAEPSAVDKTRAAIRDLQTKLRVSISAIEYISERIEVLRDEELHPQLVDLIKGYSLNGSLLTNLKRNFFFLLCCLVSFSSFD